MLKHLYIKNYALIDLLDIELYPGFSVLTGETGAGKSIILGAIGLLLGQRADSKSIKTGAFINDTPVALSMLKELGEQLVDIHSQHQNLLLNKQDFQLSVVDIIAQNQTLLADYQEIYSQLQTAKHSWLAVNRKSWSNRAICYPMQKISREHCMRLMVI